MGADSGATYHMTCSPEVLTDIRSADDKVRVGCHFLLAAEYCGSLTVVPGDSRIVELSDVAYVPDLCFNMFSLKAAQVKGVIYTPHEDSSISLFDGKLTFPDDGPGNSVWGLIISHEYPYEGSKKVMMCKIIALNSTAVTGFSACTVVPASDIRSVTGEPGLKLALRVQSLSLTPMMSLSLLQCLTLLTFPPIAFPVLAPGRSKYRLITKNINEMHSIYCHASSTLLKETAESVGIKLEGEMTPCTGCSMVKGFRKLIGGTTNTRAWKKLGTGFVDLSGPKEPSMIGKRYVKVVNDDFSRYAWVIFSRIRHHDSNRRLQGKFDRCSC